MFSQNLVAMATNFCHPRYRLKGPEYCDSSTSNLVVRAYALSKIGITSGSRTLCGYKIAARLNSILSSLLSTSGSKSFFARPAEQQESYYEGIFHMFIKSQ